MSSDSFGESQNHHRESSPSPGQTNGPTNIVHQAKPPFDPGVAQHPTVNGSTTPVPDISTDAAIQTTGARPVGAQSAAATGQTASPGSITGSPMTHLDQPQADQVMARALRGMRGAINQNGGNVTLRLNPPELGSLRISLQMNNGVVQAQFHASNSTVAQLLDQNMSSLRVALEAQGLRVEQLQTQTSPAPSAHQHSGSAGQGDTASDGQSRGMMSRDGGSAGSNHSGGGGQPDQRHGHRSFEHELVNLVA
jgi:flagellar hook-length control protein FliK